MPKSDLLRAFELGQKLAQSRALTSGLAAVFDESAHGIFLLDVDGRVRQLNRAAERPASTARRC